MESLVSFSKWLSKWFTVAVILWAAFNYALPATSSWVIPNTAYLLGLILFGMGLTLTTEDFKRIAKRPIPVVLGTVAHYVIMPGLAWLLCMIFHLKGATAAGVILVGSCPSGTSSSVMAFLSGGDVALDVSIETLSTLLAPLMIPTLLASILQSSAAQIFTSISVVTCPFRPILVTDAGLIPAFSHRSFFFMSLSMSSFQSFL